jgi:hypothetical protein
MTISKACRSAILNPPVDDTARALTVAQPNSKPQTEAIFTFLSATSLDVMFAYERPFAPIAIDRRF